MLDEQRHSSELKCAVRIELMRTNDEMRDFRFFVVQENTQHKSSAGQLRCDDRAEADDKKEMHFFSSKNFPFLILFFRFLFGFISLRVFSSSLSCIQTIKKKCRHNVENSAKSIFHAYAMCSTHVDCPVVFRLRFHVSPLVVLSIPNGRSVRHIQDSLLPDCVYLTSFKFHCRLSLCLSYSRTLALLCISFLHCQSSQMLSARAQSYAFCVNCSLVIFALHFRFASLRFTSLENSKRNETSPPVFIFLLAFVAHTFCLVVNVVSLLKNMCPLCTCTHMLTRTHSLGSMVRAGKKKREIKIETEKPETENVSGFDVLLSNSRCTMQPMAKSRPNKMIVFLFSFFSCLFCCV